MLGTLDTVIALVGEWGNIEEGYGYDAYGGDERVQLQPW